MVRLVIPVERFEDERSRIFEHFGRTPEFAVVDISDDGRITSLTSKRNMGEHFGGHGGAESVVTNLIAESPTLRLNEEAESLPEHGEPV
jgi:predicted Fe-Mo cluster-binding NifX family protein